MYPFLRTSLSRGRYLFNNYQIRSLLTLKYLIIYVVAHIQCALKHPPATLSLGEHVHV